MTDMTYEKFADSLERLGFECWGTGGGCSAWVYKDGIGEVSISQDSSHEIEAEYLETEGVCFSIVSSDYSVRNFGATTYEEALQLADQAKLYIKSDKFAFEMLNKIYAISEEL